MTYRVTATAIVISNNVRYLKQKIKTITKLYYLNNNALFYYRQLVKYSDKKAQDLKIKLFKGKFKEKLFQFRYDESETSGVDLLFNIKLLSRIDCTSGR